ncbi:MAG: type II secretion system F family protein [Candidatus Dormibacteria bacterium]
MNPLVIFFAVVAALGAAVMSGLVGRRQLSPDEKYAAKLAQIQDHEMSLAEIELAQPFSERFVKPLQARVVVFLRSRTATERQEQLRMLIQKAGHPYGIGVDGVLAAKLVAAAVGFGVGVLIATGLKLKIPFAPAEVPMFFSRLPFGLPSALLAYLLPEQWLKQKAGQRRKLIETTIPDTIDLLTICLDAGLTFDASITRLAEKVEGPLRGELVVTLSEIRYGRPRAEALEALASRVDAEDLTVFIGAVLQSQKLGTALGDTVRIQAAEIRRRRRQAAEEKASQASLKMLFPMIGCIFPTLFIALMGPVAILLVTRH